MTTPTAELIVSFVDRLDFYITLDKPGMVAYQMYEFNASGDPIEIIGGSGGGTGEDATKIIDGSGGARMRTRLPGPFVQAACLRPVTSRSPRQCRSGAASIPKRVCHGGATHSKWARGVEGPSWANVCLVHAHCGEGAIANRGIRRVRSEWDSDHERQVRGPFGAGRRQAAGHSAAGMPSGVDHGVSHKHEGGNYLLRAVHHCR